MLRSSSKLLTLALLLSVGAVPMGQAASFDCDKASTATEIAICADPELSALDKLMGLLWKKQAQVSKKRLTEQKKWLGKRDECSADLECLKTSYQLRLQSENFPYKLSNFKIVELYNNSIKSLDYYLVTDAFGGAYNMANKVAEIAAKDLLNISWTVPQFDENYQTCNLNNLDTNTVIFEESYAVNGWISFMENRQVEVYRKWVGHGDLSSEVTYILNDGKFIPVKGKVDNCTDGQVKYSNIKFESVK